jgi:hypothetical protein
MRTNGLRIGRSLQRRSNDERVPWRVYQSRLHLVRPSHRMGMSLLNRPRGSNRGCALIVQGVQRLLCRTPRRSDCDQARSRLVWDFEKSLFRFLFCSSSALLGDLHHVISMRSSGPKDLIRHGDRKGGHHSNSPFAPHSVPSRSVHSGWWVRPPSSGACLVSDN